MQNFLTWQVVWGFELVSDVSALKDFQDQLIPLCLHLFLKSNLDFPNYLCFTT